MKQVNFLLERVRSYRDSNKFLYAAALMLFFWSIFDGILSYVTPLIITGDGYSTTAMGLIYGSSSISGAVFDLVLVRILKNTHFRRLYLVMFMISFIYPLILWNAKTLPLYLVVMAVWGIYYDLKNFGTYDFIGRNSPEEEHSSSFGVINFFRIMGYLTAPLIAGLVVSDLIDPKPIYLAIFFLSVSFMLFIFLAFSSKNEPRLIESQTERGLERRSFKEELILMKKIGLILLPVLFFTLFTNLTDAFFWTVGPLYSHDVHIFDNFEGLLMTMYLLPSLIAYWFVGRVTRKYGKKRTAFFSLFLGSLTLTLLWFEPSPLSVFGIVFVASFLSSWAWPAIDGAYADYLSETESFDKEIASLSDIFINLGWVFGPPLAGFLADITGIEKSFALLGFGGIIVSIWAHLRAPKKIEIEKKLGI